MEDIQLKIKGKKVHEEIEEHHKNMEKIAREAKSLVPYKEKRDFGIKREEKGMPDGPKRVKTGVEGFDELIEGGIPAKSVVLLTGTCGTGKSIFAMNYIIEGALNGENGVYISLQESMEETINQMKYFNWPIDKLVEEGKMLIVQPELYNFDALLTTIEDAIDKIDAKRLVIDSISIIGMYFEDPFKIRKSLLELAQMLKKLGCTTLAVSEVGEDKSELSPFGVEEFVVDGVIVMYFLKKGSIFVRAIATRKMRSTHHSIKIHPIEIRRAGGIIVYPSEEVFSEVE